MSAALSHIPVLLAEAIDTLAPQDGGVYLDATFGGGGYAHAILQRAACTLWAIDRDPAAIARGAALAARFPGRLHLVEGGFGDMLRLLAAQGVAELDGVVLDLGESREVRQVDLTAVGDTTASVYVLAEPPTTVEGLTPAGEIRTGRDASLVLPKAVAGQYVLVWLTALPPADGGYRGEIVDVVVQG